MLIIRTGIHKLISALSLESPDDVDSRPATTMRYVDESDPDIIYPQSMPTTTKRPDDIVTIGVHDLTLNENCPVFTDDNCEKVFVSVEFLDYTGENLETPYALVKGEPNVKHSFNFQTSINDILQLITISKYVFVLKIVQYVISLRNNSLLNLLGHVHLESKSLRICHMVTSFEFFRIRFVVVAEPPEDQPNLDCVDIGCATVNAKQLLQNNTDLIEKPIDGKRVLFILMALFDVPFPL